MVFPLWPCRLEILNEFLLQKVGVVELQLAGGDFIGAGAVVAQLADTQVRLRSARVGRRRGR